MDFFLIKFLVKLVVLFVIVIVIGPLRLGSFYILFIYLVLLLVGCVRFDGCQHS